MDAEDIKMRIRDRMFNKNLLSPSPEMPDTQEAGPGRPALPPMSGSMETAYGGQIAGGRVKRMIEKVPVLGRLLLWSWRIINLPRWFRQLRDHFLKVASDVDYLKSAASGNSAMARTLRASLDAQGRAAEEAKASLEGLSAEIRGAAGSFRDKSARLDELLGRHGEELSQLRLAAREREGALLRMQASLDALHDGLAKIRESVESFSLAMRKVEDHGQALDRLNASLDNLRHEIAQANKPVEVEDALVMEIPRYVERSSAPGDEDGFYLEFENVFRGTEAAIAERQKRYLDYVREARAGAAGGAYFLDVGCGRGEFLKLLKAESVPCKGLEVNKVEYEKLRAEGLDVALSDANAFLGKLKDGSLAGISAFQVVEHFSLEYLGKFLALAYRKTARNGVVILETVNPKCGFALGNFHLDMSHVRPCPPELLKFLLEWHGYGDVAVVFSAPCAPQFRVKGAAEHNYLDYAAVGWKR